MAPSIHYNISITIVHLCDKKNRKRKQRKNIYSNKCVSDAQYKPYLAVNLHKIRSYYYTHLMMWWKAEFAHHYRFVLRIGQKASQIKTETGSNNSSCISFKAHRIDRLYKHKNVAQITVMIAYEISPYKCVVLAFHCFVYNFIVMHRVGCYQSFFNQSLISISEMYWGDASIRALYVCSCRSQISREQPRPNWKVIEAFGMDPQTCSLFFIAYWH